MLTKAQTDMRVTVIPAKPKEEMSGGIDTIKRVAAYCRVSTDQDDQINSYDAQCSFFTECIDSHEGWKKVKVFADEGITGTQAKKRPEFMKMLRYCRQGRIDIILAKSFSRFARNTVESIQYVRELKSLGIAVIFDKGNINTLEQTDEMFITLFSWFAQAESESISKNVTWGIRRSFEQGNFSMHYSTTLGYEKGEDGEPKIVPEEAETIRMIYSMFLDGSSYRDTFRENDYTKYDSEFKRLSEEIEKINEQILAEHEKLAERSVSADRMQSILDRIENTDFRLTEYDDVITRSFIERIIVINKHTIKIRFKGGYETVQALD